MKTVNQMLAAPLIWLVRAYQVVLSPMLPQTCRFTPSCSAYALTALRRYGPLKGGWLTLKRLGRCNPWNPGGVDHVPDAGDDSHQAPFPSPSPVATRDV